MSIIEKLASQQGLKDESANINLAIEIVKSGDDIGLRELIQGLDDKRIQNDCIKTIYEIGERNGKLLVPFLSVFIDLLSSKNNRLQWGAMCAINSVTLQIPTEVFASICRLEDAANKGSVITRDNFVKILTKLMGNSEHQEVAFRKLSQQLNNAPANQFPMYAEEIMTTIPKQHVAEFRKILESRKDELPKESQKKRIDKVLKKLK